MPWPMCFRGSVKKVVMVTEKAWGRDEGCYQPFSSESSAETTATCTSYFSSRIKTEFSRRPIEALRLIIINCTALKHSRLTFDGGTSRNGLTMRSL